jgi:A/G-specific adenine glycosylase
VPTQSGSGFTTSSHIRRVRRSLLAWGRRHFRPFAWRADRDPFRTLVTELLLKQTTAERVVRVRSELVRRFPTPAMLAAAEPAELEAIIASLGLGKQRTEHLIELGRALSGRPLRRATPARLLALPGVGSYTAAAVCCFAWGRAEPALDVNVARIIVRVFGIATPRGEPRRHRVVLDLASHLVAGRQPREVNWALLDLGADVCRPRPLCARCPLDHLCVHSLRQNSGYDPADVDHATMTES